LFVVSEFFLFLFSPLLVQYRLCGGVDFLGYPQFNNLTLPTPPSPPTHYFSPCATPPFLLLWGGRRVFFFFSAFAVPFFTFCWPTFLLAPRFNHLLLVHPLFFRKPSLTGGGRFDVSQHSTSVGPFGFLVVRQLRVTTAFFTCVLWILSSCAPLFVARSVTNCFFPKSSSFLDHLLLRPFSPPQKDLLARFPLFSYIICHPVVDPFDDPADAVLPFR